MSLITRTCFKKSICFFAILVVCMHNQLSFAGNWNRETQSGKYNSEYCRSFNSLSPNEKNEVIQNLKSWNFLSADVDECDSKLLTAIKEFEEIWSSKRSGQRTPDQLITQLKNFFLYRNILVGDQIETYFPHGRNVPGAPLRIVQHAGRNALNVKLRISDGGGVGDWDRDGQPGSAQRIEFGPDANRFAQEYDTGYWMRVSVYIPEDFEVDNRLTLSDFKSKDGSALSYLHTLQFQRWGNEVVLALDTYADAHDLKCFDILDLAGNQGAECQGSHTVYLLAGSTVPLPLGQWMDVVMFSKLGNPDGEFHIWLNGEKKLGIKGNTSHWFKQVSWKAGFYRNGMQEPGNKQPTQDLNAYISHIGASKDCKKLEIPGPLCSTMETQRGDETSADYQKIFTQDAKRVEDGLVPRGWKILKSYP